MTWDVQTAARTVVMEARGESEDGQHAVAWTLRNRLEEGSWGKSLASVCLWHAQYSGWWCPRKSGGKSYRDPNFAYATGLRDDDPLLLRMVAIVSSVMIAPVANDVTKSATHYYSTDIPPPSWVDTMTFTVQIGKHRFYRAKGA